MNITARALANKTDLTLEELQHFTGLAAWVVCEYGEVYAPIFERFERELEQRKKVENVKLRAAAFLTNRGKLVIDQNY